MSQSLIHPSNDPLRVSFTLRTHTHTHTHTHTPAEAPTLTSLLPASTQQLEYGSPLALTCAASTSLDLTWRWYHNGVEIAEETDATLSIASTVLEDSGTYQCFAYNSAGVDSSATLVNVISRSLYILIIYYIDPGIQLWCNWGQK